MFRTNTGPPSEVQAAIGTCRTAFISTAVFSLVINLLMLAGPHVDTNVWSFGIGTTQTLVSVYAMRMAAVFTLSVSTVGLRTSAFPRWVSYLGYAVALLLLIAAGEHKWTQLVFPLWVLLLSVVILLTRPPVWEVATSENQ